MSPLPAPSAGGNKPEVDLYFDVPVSARVWDYWLGGKDNYEVDQLAAEQGKRLYPLIDRLAWLSREVSRHAVRYLAREAGVRQFLDIGCGLPMPPNTDELAHDVGPESSVVYVDNDPVVLAHARALMAGQFGPGVVAHVNADVRAPEDLVSRVSEFLNFGQPVAVLCMNVLGHVETGEQMREIVRTLMDAVCPDSYLVLWDGVDDSEQFVQSWDEYNRRGGRPAYHPRPRSQIRSAFDGLELLDPGAVDPATWLRFASEPAQPPRSANVIDHVPELSACGAVARKP